MATPVFNRQPLSSYPVLADWIHLQSGRGSKKEALQEPNSLTLAKSAQTFRRTSPMSNLYFLKNSHKSCTLKQYSYGICYVLGTIKSTFTYINSFNSHNNSISQVRETGPCEVSIWFPRPHLSGVVESRMKTV